MTFAHPIRQSKTARRRAERQVSSPISCPAIFGQDTKAMSFDIKGDRNAAVDEILARVNKLSATDKRAFMKAIRQQERKEDIA